ncbi:MAG: VCBS repeat-containing protein [Candidatus Aureabacteria bacterium]|nr:VCBS repeat-containing protein [Candidatus Auribacterota bacterium]
MKTFGVVSLTVLLGVTLQYEARAQSGGALFSDPVTYNVGNGAAGIALGDFNGDKVLDIAIPNSDDNDVSILLGNGDGSFGAATDYAAGDSPCSIAVGDFNGDENLDIAMTNSDDDSVSILIGNGAGAFAAPVGYTVGKSPCSIAVGDFNGDKNLDLAVVNGDSKSISVLIGNGDGRFASAVNYGVGWLPDSVAANDLNGDGNLDLAVVNYGDESISVLRGNGDGTFGFAVDHPAGPRPSSVVLSDFNGDGNPDIAMDNGSNYADWPQDVTVLLNSGSGVFAPGVGYYGGCQIESLASGDLNGDGKPDLVVRDYTCGCVAILMNTAPTPAPALTIWPSSSKLPWVFESTGWFYLVVRLMENVTLSFDVYLVAAPPGGIYTVLPNGTVEAGIKALYRNVPPLSAPYSMKVQPNISIPESLVDHDVTFYICLVEAGKMPPIRSLRELNHDTPYVIMFDRKTMRVTWGTCGPDRP